MAKLGPLKVEIAIVDKEEIAMLLQGYADLISVKLLLVLLVALTLQFGWGFALGALAHKIFS